MVKIGLLGFGTVGQGVVAILESQEDYEVKKILVRSLDKERQVKVSQDKLTLDANEIIEDEEINIIIEVTGDVDLSYRLLKRAMENKKHVVTANKALVSAYFEELSQLAEDNNVYFLYEASVAGGIPVLKSLKDQIKLNKITRIQGILNGTCNYILTKMTDQGLDYAEVLKEAQNLGYAEADPSSDVEGLDSLRKLRILSSLGLGASIKEEDIICYGINKLSALDIKLLKEKEMVVKLIGETIEVEGGFQSIVQPKAVNKDDYFAMVNEAFNSVSIEGEFSGPLKFYGAGAGMFPTANAVLTDVIDCVKGTQDIKNPLRDRKLENKNKDIQGKYYVRIVKAKDEDYKKLKDILEEVLVKDENNLAVITKETKLAILLDKIEEVAKEYALIKFGN